VKKQSKEQKLETELERKSRITPDKMWDNLSGFWSVWLIHVGSDLGLFEAFRKGPLTVDEVADAKGYEKVYVEVWCSTASQFGFLDGNAVDGYRVTSGWGHLLEHYGDWASTYIRLSQRVDQSIEAVFKGRAFPESSLSLQMAMSQGIRASYRNLWEDVVPKIPELLELMQPGNRVIEYGCGFGTGLEILKDRFPGIEATGIESDFDCAQEAERSTSAVIVVGRPEDSSYVNRFDIALFHRSLSVCNDPFLALNRAYDALKPGGMLILQSEAELAAGAQTEARNKVRICERMFFQMFFTDQALRSTSLSELELWAEAKQMRIVYSDPSPRRGSPCLVLEKSSEI
jgi:SAM-dependent methyltransferase